MSPVETRASSIPIKSLSPRSSLSVDDAIGFGTLLPVPLSEIRISPLRRSLAEIFHFLVVPGHACAAAAFVLKLQVSWSPSCLLQQRTASRTSIITASIRIRRRLRTAILPQLPRNVDPHARD